MGRHSCKGRHECACGTNVHFQDILACAASHVPPSYYPCQPEAFQPQCNVLAASTLVCELFSPTACHKFSALGRTFPRRLRTRFGQRSLGDRLAPNGAEAPDNTRADTTERRPSGNTARLDPVPHNSCISAASLGLMAASTRMNSKSSPASSPSAWRGPSAIRRRSRHTAPAAAP